MEKMKIIEELKKHDTTVLSFPERGEWGNPHYRGNCTGWIPAYFIWKYNVKKLAEIFAGSGTTYDVCQDMDVCYTGIDLNPTPVRPGIISMDILDDSVELPNGFYDADMVFLHPPYPTIRGIQYANVMWEDTIGLASRDIQGMSWEEGMRAVNKSLLRGYTALPPGGFEVILVGEIRSRGQYRSMMQNLVIPGVLHQTFVKMQHHTTSGNTKCHCKCNFAKTVHEMIAVIKKPSGYEIAYIFPKKYAYDIRDSKSATWKDVVISVLRNARCEVSNQWIYNALKNHEKAKMNNNVEATIRRTLQNLEKSGFVKHTGIGRWVITEC